MPYEYNTLAMIFLVPEACNRHLTPDEQKQIILLADQLAKLPADRFTTHQAGTA